MMVRTPRPSSPSRRAQVPSSSTSAEALDRLPSLSFSRCSRNVLRVAVRQHPRHARSRSARRAPGPARGTRRTSAPSRTTCARSAGSSPSGRRGTARVVLARTSEPPCFSVIPIPASSAALVRRLAQAGVVRPVRSAAAPSAAASAGSVRRAGTAAYVIEIGQPCPASTCDQTTKPAARRTWRAGARRSPRAPRAGPADGDVHQRVPGRVEVDLVDPVAVPVVGAQHGRVRVGLDAPALRLLRAGPAAEGGQAVEGLRPRRTAAPPRPARRRPGRRRGRPAAAAGSSPHGWSRLMGLP